MKKVIEIINRLKSTTKTNEKIEILKENKNNELLQKVLFYTYNDFFKYKISEDFLNNKKDYNFGKNSDIKKQYMDYINNDVFILLDILKSKNINDCLREITFCFLNKQDDDIRQLYKQMILKDLKINCNAKTINKVWKNLIPTFEIQLAENYFDRMDYLKDKEITITPKLDGHRCLAFKYENYTKFFTRQGKEIEGLVELEETFKKMSVGVYDGEIITKYDISPDEQYKETSKIIRKKGNKKDLKFIIFDTIRMENFYHKEAFTPYGNKFLFDIPLNSNVEQIEKLYSGIYDENIVNKLLEEYTNKNYEGLMINVNSEPYQFKRTKNLLKVKKMRTADVFVKDIIEGTGKNKGLLGSIEIEFEYNQQKYTCFCGSGFNDEQRQLYFNNKELLLNKIIEVQYFEITKNHKGGYGLRFPVFKYIRDDKTKEDLSIY